MKTFSTLTLTAIMLISSVNAGWFSRDSRFEKFQKNTPIDYIKNRDNKCTHFIIDENKKNKQQIVTNTLRNLNSLEAIYCDRMFAENAKDFFSNPNKDVPADKIPNPTSKLLSIDNVKEVKWIIAGKYNYSTKENIQLKTQLTNKINDRYSTLDHINHRVASAYGIRDTTYIRNISPQHQSMWKDKNFMVNRDFLYNSTDWDEILEMNIEAKSIWEELIASAPEELSSGISKESYARKSYYSGKRLSNNKKIHKQLLKRIKVYKHNIDIFLQTSSLNDTAGLTLINKYHPFFIQTLLEHYADYRTHFESKKSNHNDRRNINEIIKATFVTSGDKVQEFYLKQFDPAYHAPMIPKNNLFRKTINTLIILNQNRTGCLNWGLWPGTTKYLTNLDFRKYSGSSLSEISYYNEPLAFIFYELHHRIKSDCGGFDPVERFSFWGGSPLSQWEKGLAKKNANILINYKKLFNRYTR